MSHQSYTVIVYSECPDFVPEVLPNHKLTKNHILHISEAPLTLCDLCRKFVNVNYDCNRWRQAEKYVLLNSLASYLYTMHIIGGRWRDAEPTILRDHYCTYAYAVNILEKRWYEAEEIIKRSIWCKRYEKRFDCRL